LNPERLIAKHKTGLRTWTEIFLNGSNSKHRTVFERDDTGSIEANNRIQRLRQDQSDLRDQAFCTHLTSPATIVALGRPFTCQAWNGEFRLLPTN
jgi:hypothetical protein